jgi:hypothetical protein
VSRFASLLGLAAAGAAALVVERARRIAEEEDRPVSEVLAEMPGRIMADLRTIPDDLRDAADEGRAAAERREHEIDDDIRTAREGRSA